MNKNFKLRALLVVGAMLMLPVAQAATMAKSDYQAGKTRIGADYKANKTACDALADNAKDICVQEAKGIHRVALAELEYGYSAKSTDHNKLLVAKAESAYAVAKEKCDDKAGNDKDVCVKEAKAIETTALADAKMGREISAAKTDADADKRDADYDVAEEKCNSMAGDTKASCIAAAKAKFGKT